MWIVLSVDNKPFRHNSNRKRDGPTRNQGSADKNVNLFTLLGEKGHLRLNELLGHLFGVAAHPLTRLFDVHF